MEANVSPPRREGRMARPRHLAVAAATALVALCAAALPFCGDCASVEGAGHELAPLEADPGYLVAEGAVHRRKLGRRSLLSWKILTWMECWQLGDPVDKPDQSRLQPWKKLGEIRSKWWHRLEAARQMVGPRGGMPTLKQDLVRLATLLHVSLDGDETVEKLKVKIRPTLRLLQQTAPPPDGKVAAGAQQYL